MSRHPAEDPVGAGLRHGKAHGVSRFLGQAFEGLVLSAGVALTGGRKEAFLLLGLDAIVENRNHNKQFKQALSRLFAALEAMGEEPDPELKAQVKE